MELVLPQAGKMTHALKKLHILERCFRTGAEGKAAPSALHESKGIFSFAKENIPFGTPRERLCLAASGLNYFDASGMQLPARGEAALELQDDLPLLLLSAAALPIL